MTDPRFHPPGQLAGVAILAATGGAPRGGFDPTARRSVTTDSRLAGPGSLFVALRGELHDGHDHAAAAAAAGADVLVERGRLPTGVAGVEVDDTLVALGALGAAFRRLTEPSVAAVTGSVGKTTTRSMLGAILAQLGPGLVTDGNLNNRIGVPLTLLQLRPEHRWAVLEMGMSEPGEIAALAAIGQPRVRAITEVAAAHLAFFPDVEAIADAKGELFEGARPGDTLVFPAGHPLAGRFPRPRGAVLLPFARAVGGDAPVRAISAEDRGPHGVVAHIEVPGHRLRVHLPLPGLHQLSNALCAAAAAWAMGAPPDAIEAGLAHFEVPGRRMKTSVRGGITVVDDAYNASPASVAAVLRSIATFPCAGRRVAALGDMLELGPQGPALHAAVGRVVAECGYDALFAVGPLMASAAEAAAQAGVEVIAVDHSEALAGALAATLRPGDLLLLKGSRGTRMERALDGLPPEDEA